MFSYDSIKEVQKFAQELTDTSLWPQFCVRAEGSGFADGLGCTYESYNNITSWIPEKELEDMKGKDRIYMDNKIKNMSGHILNNWEARGSLDKEFSKENPYSKYLAINIRTQNKVTLSIVEEGWFGFWQQRILKTYTGA